MDVILSTVKQYNRPIRMLGDLKQKNRRLHGFEMQLSEAELGVLEGDHAAYVTWIVGGGRESSSGR